MTKTTARIIALICTLGTMFLLFQARFISPEPGKHEFIYSVPGYRNVEDSAAEKLIQQLEERHGPAQDTAAIGTLQWKDQEAELLQRIDPELEVMGRTLDGKTYISCTMRTTRNAVTQAEDKILEAADHAVSYMACAPAGDEEPYILWDTMEESSSKHWQQLQLPEEAEN